MFRDLSDAGAVRNRAKQLGGHVHASVVWVLVAEILMGELEADALAHPLRGACESPESEPPAGEALDRIFAAVL
jgi:hypothetical protein